jgi:NAD(P)-dependent dehydrogenase (short-subunit alcohol dehydrogenase family)
MIFDFSGHVAVVTGGGSGIGAACAREFARAGARVAIVGRDQARLRSVVAEVGEAEILAYPIDVTDEGAVGDMLLDIVATWGRVDHLVNSAANFVAAGRDATAEQWHDSLGVNVVASARLTARLADHMVAGSTVVNIASISAHIAQPDRWTYNATKAAIVELGKCQALDLAPVGIRVNTVSPGWIWTPEVARAAHDDRAAWEPVWGDFHMLRRLGDAEEVAAPVLFLSSPAASFITGTELMVDGGYSGLGPEGLGAASVFAGAAPRTS